MWSHGGKKRIQEPVNRTTSGQAHIGSKHDKNVNRLWKFIFVIACQTQPLTVQEVVELVDLIKDLTGSATTSGANSAQGLVLLDRLDHVPDAFYPTETASSWIMMMTKTTSPRLKKSARTMATRIGGTNVENGTTPIVAVVFALAF